VFNDPSNDVDFRVESNGNTHMLFVDAGNDRVGIGQSSPAAPLDVLGNVKFANSSSNFQADFVANNSAILNFTTGTSEGVILRSDKYLRLDTGGSTERMRIDSSGRLLSGVSSAPGTVGGFSHLNIKGTSINANGAIGLYRNTASPSAGQGIGAIYFANSDGNAGAYIQGQSDGTWGTNDYPGRLVFFTTADGASSATERMRIENSGVVKLTQSGNNPRFGSLEASGDAFRLKAFSGNASHNATMQFFTGANSPTERMRIDSSGNVGIGTTSPSYELQVAQSGSASDIAATSNVSSGTASRFILGNSAGTARATFNLTGGGSETAYLGTEGNFPLYFQTNGAERMRIDSSGRLLVGATSTSIAVRGLFQASSGGTGGGVVMISRGTATPTNQQTLGEIQFADSNHTLSARISAGRDSGTWTSGSSQPTFVKINTTENGSATSVEKMRIFGDGTQHIFTKNNGVIVGTNQGAGTTYYFFRGIRSRTSNTAGGTTVYYVYSNGNVQNTNNSYGSISDAKLKENIVDATSQWDDLKALQIRKYNFIEGETHTQLGVIAQEVETVSPGLVYETTDRDEEGNDLGTVTKGVNYSVLYMKAVKALQEAMERIETLEAKVAALEAE